MKTRPALAAAALALVYCIAPAQAAQMVVVDADYTHGPETTKDSHYLVKLPATAPSNWKSPVNYAGGQAFVQLEVKTKPSDAQTRFQVCFISKPDYSCTDQSPTYTETGTFTWGTSFSKFYVGNGGSVDWAQSFQDITLILKDNANVKPAPENVGAETAARYMPTDLHVIVTIVPEGETYVPPSANPSGGTGGGGGVASLGGSAGLGGGGVGGAGGQIGEVAGASSLGGAIATGGTPEAGSSGTMMPTASAGTANASSGASALKPNPSSLDEGCACRLPRSRSSSGSQAPLALALVAALTALARRAR